MMKTTLVAAAGRARAMSRAGIFIWDSDKARGPEYDGRATPPCQSNRHLFPRRAGRQAAGMESHEWFENTDEGKVYYRANYIGNRWTIMTTMQKRNPHGPISSRCPSRSGASCATSSGRNISASAAVGTRGGPRPDPRRRTAAAVSDYRGRFRSKRVAGAACACRAVAVGTDG